MTTKFVKQCPTTQGMHVLPDCPLVDEYKAHSQTPTHGKSSKILPRLHANPDEILFEGETKETGHIVSQFAAAPFKWFQALLTGPREEFKFSAQYQ
jgi:hypothetical protein